MMRSEIFFFV